MNNNLSKQFYQQLNLMINLREIYIYFYDTKQLWHSQSWKQLNRMYRNIDFALRINSPL